MKRPTPKKKKVSVKSKDIRKIVIIFVVAFVALSLFLIFGRENAGQAIRYGEFKVGDGGIAVSGNINVDEKFTLPIKANIGIQKSTAFSFRFAFDPQFFQTSCDDKVFIPLQDKFIFEGEDYSLIRNCTLITPTNQLRDCRSFGLSRCSILSLELVWLADADEKNILRGEEILANLMFTARAVGTGKFVPQIKILNLYNEPIVLSMQESTLTVVTSALPEEPECSDDSDCAEGVCVDNVCEVLNLEFETVCSDTVDNDQDGDVDCDDSDCEDDTDCVAPTGPLDFAVEPQSLECDTRADCGGWRCAPNSVCEKESISCTNKVKYCEFVWMEGDIDKNFKLAKGDKYLIGSKLLEYFITAMSFS